MAAVSHQKFALRVAFALCFGASVATHIVAYVVSGIGFLAGGVIFKKWLRISGLDTAATLWCTAAIGAPAGALGFLGEAHENVLELNPALERESLRPLAAGYTADEAKRSAGGATRARRRVTNGRSMK